MTGCQELITGAPNTPEAVKRCFLLTDGMANVGSAEAEVIVAQVAAMRTTTSIATSTFGLGNDYHELLLGPMAVAGGGQFHHLRRPYEIVRAFLGEIGELLTIAVANLHLQIEAPKELLPQLISAFWENISMVQEIEPAETGKVKLSVDVGDLQYTEERHVIVRCTFLPPYPEQLMVRSRLVWQGETGEQQTPWQESYFTVASQAACDDEPQQPEVMQHIAQDEADKARREAITLHNPGQLTPAQDHLGMTAQALADIQTFLEAPSSQVSHELGDLHQLLLGFNPAAGPSS